MTMDFESPDVEKDFPGLYASESIRKGNESDFSDENHDKSFKKDLISGKKKEKKDSKKDRGYAALEGESSPDDDTDLRGSRKSKKTKSFKFSTKKTDKREKSKEKDSEKKDKDKKDKERDKIKNKEKKKIKFGDEISETGDFNIFGVSVIKAVERSGCLDGIPIPLIVRNCIDCIHSFGLSMDGLYRIAGMKSKVQMFKKMYNAREHVSLGDSDVPVATCLLKMFLRELPEPILTQSLLMRFEEAGAIMEVDSREKELQSLITKLPIPNKVLLGWLIVHFDAVTMQEKHNKLNAQSIAMTFSPVLQMSHRLLTAFLCHCRALFPDVHIKRYVPPLCPGSSFPEEPSEIALELKKQEFLLNQIHNEMSEGLVSKKKEEQLWEVQRIVTQLKRKLRSLQRFQEVNVTHQNSEESQQTLDDAKKQSEKQNFQLKENLKEILSEGVSTENNFISETKLSCSVSDDSDETGNSPIKSSPEKSVVEEILTDKNRNLESLKEQLEYEELIKFQKSLKNRIDREREVISMLTAKIQNYSKRTPPNFSPEKEAENIEKLEKDYFMLQNKMRNLSVKIFEERLACIKLRVCIDILTASEKEI